MPTGSSHAGTASPIWAPKGQPGAPTLPSPLPPPGQVLGSSGCHNPSPSPAGAPAGPTAGRTRHAAPGRCRGTRLSPSGQPGRRADLDGVQQRAGCQPAPAPPAQPAPLCTGTSPTAAPQAGAPKPAVPGCRPQPGPRRDPHRPPAHTLPRAGCFPTPTSRQGGTRIATRCCRK